MHIVCTGCNQADGMQMHMQLAVASSCQQGMEGTYLRIGGGGSDGHAQKLVDAGAGGEGASDLDVGDEHLDTAERGYVRKARADEGVERREAKRAKGRSVRKR